MAESRRRYRIRWRIALLLNRLPGVCYAQVSSWAHFGPEPERRVWHCRPTLSCRIDAANNGRCWCQKFAHEDFADPEAVSDAR